MRRLRECYPDVDISVWSAKRLYLSVLALLPAPAGSLVPSVPRQVAWRSTTAGWLDARRASLQWRLAHDILPLRDRFSRFGLTTPFCPFCTSRETAEHAFHHCFLPAALWHRVEVLYGVSHVRWSVIQTLLQPPVSVRDRRHFVLLATEINYQVWIARCIAVHGGHIRAVADVIRLVRAGIRSLLCRERSVLGAVEFGRRWLTSSVLFEETRGTYVVHF